MSSFCCTEIRARCASKAVDEQVVEAVDLLRDPRQVVGDVAEERRGLPCDARGTPCRGETGRIGSRSGSTARRTSAISRLRL